MVVSTPPRTISLKRHVKVGGLPVSLVRVVRAVNLMKKDIFGTSDPYCKISLYKTNRCVQPVCVDLKTQTVKRSLCPIWNEEFILRTRDDFLGRVTVYLPHLAISNDDSFCIVPKTFLLRPRGPRSRVKGNLLISLAYLPEQYDTRSETINTAPATLQPSTFESSPNPSTQSSERRVPNATGEQFSVQVDALDDDDDDGDGDVGHNGKMTTSMDTNSNVLSLTPLEDSLTDLTEQPLPNGWDERVDQNGRTYYVDHVNKRTQWDRPFRLPTGWEQRTDSNGRVYYVDQVNRRTTWFHPLSSNSRLQVSPPQLAESDDDARTESTACSPSVRQNKVHVVDNRSKPNRKKSRGKRKPKISSDDGEIEAAQTMYLRRRQVSEIDVTRHDDDNDTVDESSTQIASGSNSHPAEADNHSPSDSLSTKASTSSRNRRSSTKPAETGEILLGLELDPNEEPLPSGWELARTASGRRFFINHNAQTTTWDDPRVNKSLVFTSTSLLAQEAHKHTMMDLGPLPPGWEERVHSNGRIFYINHSARTTQWEDPRLERLGGQAVPYSRDYKQKYDYFRSRLKSPRDTQVKFEMRISRSGIFEESFRLIHGIKKPEVLMHRLWIEFIGEKGLDYGGVQREWFFLLSRQMFNPYYGLFEYSAADNYTLQINPLSGLANEEHLKYYKFIGRVVAMAIYHGKLIDGFFIRPFYKMMLGKTITLKDMEAVDSEYYRSLKYILKEDPTVLDLTMSVDEEHFGEMVEVDLIPGGRNIKVTNANKVQYIERIINWRFVSRVQKQMCAFLEGFSDLISLEALQIFDANELELLMCGLQDISVKDWQNSTVYKGEYHTNHPVIINFWKTLYTFTNELRSRLLQFVTGTSRVPMNGFSELWGSNGPQKFTIECWGNVNQLPRAHTCFNRLDLPPYSTFEELRCKLIVAIENAEGFEGVD